MLTVVALAATGAGLLLAQASGTRGSNDQVTGDIRLTNRDRLLQALDALTAQDPVGALELYDTVLETDPDNVEALTYRGWTLTLSGLLDEAMPWLDRAIELDPEYPDARAFRAITRTRLGQNDEALADLDALDLESLPPDIRGLVENLRSGLEATTPTTPATTAPPLPE